MERTHEQATEHYTPEEKVAILRRRLLDKEPISKLSAEPGLQPTVFYAGRKSSSRTGHSPSSRRSQAITPPSRSESRTWRPQAISAGNDLRVSQPTANICTGHSLYTTHVLEANSLRLMPMQERFLQLPLGLSNLWDTISFSGTGSTQPRGLERAETMAHEVHSG